MPGIGRADIVCLSTNEMWEIKHGGSTAAAWNDGINNAIGQLDRYINNGAGFSKGRAGAFSGTFSIHMDSRTYLVTYKTPKEGVILYTVGPLQGQQTAPAHAFNYAPYTLYDKDTAYALAPAAFLLVTVGIAAYLCIQLDSQSASAG